MDREKLQAQVAALVQSAAFLVLIFYVVGFLVVSVRLALFGITQFSLLRARILSAGILFAVFFTVAIVLAARIFALFGYEEWNLLRVADRATAGRRLVFRWVNFFISAMAFCLLLRIFLQDHLHWTLTNWLMLPAACVATQMGVRQFEKRPRLAALMGLVAIALVVALFYLFRDFGMLALVTWFTWIALMAHFINAPVQDPGKIRHLRWDTWAASFVATVALFAVFLYPQIYSALGGGVPVPVTIQFLDKSPLDGANRTKVWLLDETDLGFYVLTAKDKGKAVFLPRSAVSAVFFGEAPELQTPGTKTHP